MGKADEKVNSNIAEVSKTLHGIDKVMKQCIEILSNIAALHMYSYHQQILQDSFITYLNEPTINKQGTKQNKKLQSKIIVFYKDIYRLLTVVVLIYVKPEVNARVFITIVFALHCF